MKVGLTFDIGLNDKTQIGTDLLSSIGGAPNFRIKHRVFQQRDHTVSFALAGTYLNRKTALWGVYHDNFAELDVRVVQPQLSWSQIISKRLILHSHWRLSIGPTHARLSEEGLRWYQGSKSNGPLPVNDNSAKSSNQAKGGMNTELSQRTLQIQSLLGLSRDLFQLTGELQRDRSKSLFMTSRIEQLALEDLRSKSLRLTAAQQWQVGRFNFRLGAGLAYIVLSGRDLDQVTIDDAGWHPVADLDFYWLF
ncbi:MAG: hypothetical protein ACOH5I_02860 [Oligoflexus sp.]